jgi:hypothetical protein
MSRALRRFAADTRVPVERTKQELERLVRAHGADGFAAGWDAHQDRVEFLWKGKQIRFVLPRPTAFAASKREQLDRQRWRALLLVVKAKLEAVHAGLAVFEQEFLGFIVVPSTGRTIYEHAAPRLEAGDWSSDRLLPPGEGEPG